MLSLPLCEEKETNKTHKRKASGLRYTSTAPKAFCWILLPRSRHYRPSQVLLNIRQHARTGKGDQHQNNTILCIVSLPDYSCNFLRLGEKRRREKFLFYSRRNTLSKISPITYETILRFHIDPHMRDIISCNFGINEQTKPLLHAYLYLVFLPTWN